MSTAITSSITLSDWGRYLGDITLTAVILDGLAMHAIRIVRTRSASTSPARALASTSPDPRHGPRCVLSPGGIVVARAPAR